MRIKHVSLLLCILTISVFLFSQAMSQGNATFFIRPDGLWISYNNNSNPFLTLGMSVSDAIKQIGREPENSNAGILTYISSGKDVPYGFYLYTYNIFTGSGRGDTTASTIKTIEIWSPDIKTIKGVGVGSTCAEVWEAHGKEYTEDRIGPYGAGFYYKVNNSRMFFVVGPEVSDENSIVYPSDHVTIRSIAIFQ